MVFIMKNVNKVLVYLGIALTAMLAVMFIVYQSQDFNMWFNYEGFFGAIGRIFGLGMFSAPDFMGFVASNIGYVMNLLVLLMFIFMVLSVIKKRVLKIVFMFIGSLFVIAGQFLLMIMGQQLIIDPVIITAAIAAVYQLLLGIFQIIMKKKIADVTETTEATETAEAKEQT